MRPSELRHNPMPYPHKSNRHSCERVDQRLPRCSIRFHAPSSQSRRRSKLHAVALDGPVPLGPATDEMVVCDAGVARACHLTATDARVTLETASLGARGLRANHRRALDYLRDRTLGTVRLAGRLGITPKALQTLIEPGLLRMRLGVPSAQGLVAAARCNAAGAYARCQAWMICSRPPLPPSPDHL